MPIKSKKQLRAMFAASESRGTIGIPPNVAKEFLKKTTKATKARLMRKKTY